MLKFEDYLNKQADKICDSPRPMFFSNCDL